MSFSAEQNNSSKQSSPKNSYSELVEFQATTNMTFEYRNLGSCDENDTNIMIMEVEGASQKREDEVAISPRAVATSTHGAVEATKARQQQSNVTKDLASLLDRG